MKSLSALMLVLISAALLSLTTVAACSCQAREFPEHYCTSDVVLECMFTSRRTSQDKVIYNCRLDAVHKGNVTTRVIQVVTPKNGALCGVTFLTGCNAPTYLITGRLEVISAALNQKVVHVNLCNYVSDEPSDDVKEFLRNPSCPCSDRKCQPWQECRIYQHPNCLNITTDVRILKTDVNTISRDSEQLSGNLDVAAPVERCRESYCADTCKNFPCPTGQQCRLVDVNCFREPCPPVARCMPYDPCATILCLPNHKCKVSDDGQPFCEPQCPECRPGYHCEKVQVFCVTSPCPPQYTCVKDDPVDPCNLTVSYGTAIDGVTDAEERYFFNKTARKCQKFYYNGVGGNDNQFATMAECEKVCPEVPPCRQPVEVGPCEAALPRWFYNSTSQQCEQFIYGGCRGNDNNFATQRQCDATCPAPSPCKLRADPGTCTGQVTAFHYSEDAGTCVAFNYSGCGGNANRFDSITACLQKCPPPSPCVQPLLHGVGNTIVERYYFDSTALMCKPFKFRGAGGNLNNFESLAECNRTCPAPNPCRLKPEQGPCRATFRRWYYDYQEGRCKRFIYGGCQGNRNNFETLAECQGVCPPVRVCHLPKVEGPCDARVPRWWYNRATKRCERFVYGGCDGNRNNFLSLAACQERCDEPCKPKEPCDLIRCRPHQKCRVYNYTGEPYCVDTCDGFPCKPGYSCKLRDVFCLRAPCPPVATCVPDPVANDTCELDIVPGPCKAYIPRWAYDKETGVCRRFIYGGCGGNSNNFQTQAQCMQKCRPAGVCRLPIDEGPCDGVHARWAFDSKLGRCTQFNWGGCRGNRNRFLTQAACEQVCPAVPPCKQPKYSAKNDSVVCTAIVRYYYDKLSGSCKLYPADECPLNDNWFPDASTCESTCPVDSCNLNPDPGPCCDYQVRWYYDSQFGKCRRFRYGGCRGNSNNYESEEACMQGCHPDKCQLPVLVGRVDADDTREVRYAHNPKSGLCEAFLWGKIDDNANNFLTLDECEATCPPNPNECPGCSAGTGLVSTSVSLQTINPQYGFCCLPNTAHRGVCCCPAASDREASCVNGAQFFATHPGIDEADTVDLSAIENRFVPVPELYSTDDENM